MIFFSNIQWEKKRERGWSKESRWPQTASEGNSGPENDESVCTRFKIKVIQGNYPQPICHSNIKVAGILKHERTQEIELPWALLKGKATWQSHSSKPNLKGKLC